MCGCDEFYMLLLLGVLLSHSCTTCWAQQPITRWDGPYDLPVIAVAMANLPDGKVLFWSAYDQFRSARTGRDEKTWTAVWDPVNDANAPATAVLSSTTGHDMFCPGTSVLADGRVMVTGGSNNGRTSIYQNGEWRRSDEMRIGRGYHSNTVLTDGSVLTLGGSWYDLKGASDFKTLYGDLLGDVIWFLRYTLFDWFFRAFFPWPRKDAEVWDATRETWRKLNNVKCQGSLLTNDSRGQYRNDNHMWLFQAPNGKIFHAGPSIMTHWITTEGNDGSVEPIEQRGNEDAMNGNALMVDIAKILVLGGAENYDESPATKKAYVIELDPTGTSDSVTIRRVGDLHQPRAMGNAVALPTGQVIVVGGNRQAIVFDDSQAVLTAELWDPVTEEFTELNPPMMIPRTYHSTAMLLQDGRILTAGGGLCNRDCDLNYFNGEILTPPYLFAADGNLAARPVIVSAPTTAKAGDAIVVQTTSAVQVDKFALVRLSAATHAVNNDVRRIPLPVESSSGNDYTLRLPMNPAVCLTGTYFLFALSAAGGVPSIATHLTIEIPSS